MTHTPGRSTVVGVFHEPDRAREAIEALKEEGFAADNISVLSPDKRTTESMAEETGTHAGSGAATGAVTGGVLGGLAYVGIARVRKDAALTSLAPEVPGDEDLSQQPVSGATS